MKTNKYYKLLTESKTTCGYSRHFVEGLNTDPMYNLPVRGEPTSFDLAGFTFGNLKYISDCLLKYSTIDEVCLYEVTVPEDAYFKEIKGGRLENEDQGTYYANMISLKKLGHVWDEKIIDLITNEVQDRDELLLLASGIASCSMFGSSSTEPFENLILLFNNKFNSEELRDFYYLTVERILDNIIQRDKASDERDVKFINGVLESIALTDGELGYIAGEASFMCDLPMMKAAIEKMTELEPHLDTALTGCSEGFVNGMEYLLGIEKLDFSKIHTHDNVLANILYYMNEAYKFSLFVSVYHRGYPINSETVYDLLVNQHDILGRLVFHHDLEVGYYMTDPVENAKHISSICHIKFDKLKNAVLDSMEKFAVQFETDIIVHYLFHLTKIANSARLFKYVVDKFFAQYGREREVVCDSFDLEYFVKAKPVDNNPYSMFSYGMSLFEAAIYSEQFEIADYLYEIMKKHNVSVDNIEYMPFDICELDTDAVLKYFEKIRITPKHMNEDGLKKVNWFYTKQGG